MKAAAVTAAALSLSLTLILTLTLNRPKNNSGELTDKYPYYIIFRPVAYTTACTTVQAVIYIKLDVNQLRQTPFIHSDGPTNQPNHPRHYTSHLSEHYYECYTHNTRASESLYGRCPERGHCPASSVSSSLIPPHTHRHSRETMTTRATDRNYLLMDTNMRGWPSPHLSPFRKSRLLTQQWLPIFMWLREKWSPMSDSELSRSQSLPLSTSLHSDVI